MQAPKCLACALRLPLPQTLPAVVVKSIFRYTGFSVVCNTNGLNTAADYWFKVFDSHFRVVSSV